MKILENPAQEKLELQCNWPLTGDSVVVIAGAYTGTVARDYIQKYDCILYLYEPQAWAYDHMAKHFAFQPKVHLFNFGLGVKSGVSLVREYGTDGCSFVDVGTDSQKVTDCRLVEAEIVLPPVVDVFICNMEGYEHLLIPYLVEKGLIRNIKYILCQIHGGDREALNRLMNPTHKGGEWIPGGWALWERNG